ncbi:hypothetical protein F4814DRAFT_315304 [Daldinia grandis]|nr:hypothetical protein F4814DRAFT_315304 [Daldinia grandis]
MALENDWIEGVGIGLIEFLMLGVFLVLGSIWKGKRGSLSSLYDSYDRHSTSPTSSYTSRFRRRYRVPAFISWYHIHAFAAVSIAIGIDTECWGVHARFGYKGLRIYGITGCTVYLYGQRFNAMVAGVLG